MKPVALRDDSLKNRKFLRCESEMTDAQFGQCNKAHDAGVRRCHMVGSIAVQSEEDLLTPSLVKAVMLRLVSRGTR